MVEYREQANPEGLVPEEAIDPTLKGQLHNPTIILSRYGLTQKTMMFTLMAFLIM